MVKRQPAPRRSQRQHIKYVGIAKQTLVRYARAVRQFFDYLDLMRRPLPNSFYTLDREVGEYINHLFQEGEPHGYVGDLLSGLKRFVPGAKRQLDTGTRYFKDWGRMLRRRRATPLPVDLLRAMSGAAYAQGRSDLGVLLLVGFLGLLRTGEVVDLRKKQCSILGGGTRALIVFKASKGAVRQNAPESVLLHDPLVVQLLARRLDQLQGNDKLYAGGFRGFADDIKKFAAYFGVVDPYLTPYCLRRGGATWHFATFTNLDATQHLGRWMQKRTAKQYIDEAMVAYAEEGIPAAGRARAQVAHRVLDGLLSHTL
jgi:hypothetical protein